MRHLLYKIRQRSGDESGFTLIELLVVILIIGILSAIAIPALLSQKAKASDAVAKEVAASAQSAIETYSTDHNGEYTDATPEKLVEYDGSLPITEGKGEAYLSAINGEGGTGSPGKGYTVTAKSTNGDTYSIERTDEGVTNHKCTIPAEGGGPHAGCNLEGADKSGSGSW